MVPTAAENFTFQQSSLWTSIVRPSVDESCKNFSSSLCTLLLALVPATAMFYVFNYLVSRIRSFYSTSLSASVSEDWLEMVIHLFTESESIVYLWTCDAAHLISKDVKCDDRFEVKEHPLCSLYWSIAYCSLQSTEIAIMQALFHKPSNITLKMQFKIEKDRLKK
jgi:hypothetical protein